MINIYDGSTLFVSSPFRWKTLFSKPLKYIIHIFTGSNIEHAARYIDGYVINMSGDGGQLIHIDEWLKEYCVNGAKIHYIEPFVELTDEQIKKLKSFDQSFVGKKYDALGAVISALDEVKQIRDLGIKTRNIFCSQQVFDGYILIGLFPKQKDRVSPAELKAKLLKSPYFCDKWKRLR